MLSNEKAIEAPTEQLPKVHGLGMRHLQVLLLFLVIVVLFLNRMHVAISLVAMTNANKSNPDFPEYNWNEQQKSYILSSFYWGYIVAQLPGTYLLRRFGVKINLLLYTFQTGLLSVLMPLSISLGGWQAFCLLRLLQGLTQGAMYSAVMQHLANWSPPLERSVLVGFVHASYDCSELLAMALSGVIATTSLGWPGTFYIYSGFCFLWCALWQIFGANNVTKSKFITNEEKLYIERSLANSVSFQQRRLPVPWRAMLTSKPFIVLLIVRALSLGGYITLQTEWPTYLNGSLKLNFKENTLYSTLPFAVTLFSTFVYAFIADFITKRNLLSLTALRKCFNSFGLWTPAIGLIALGFVDENHKQLAMIAMIIIVVSHSSGNFGFSVCLIEIAPNHTEISTAIANTVSNIFVLLGPLSVGLIVNDEHNKHQWQLAFATLAVGFCIGDLLFMSWGTAEEQPWNAADFLANENNERQIEKGKIPKYSRKSNL